MVSLSDMIPFCSTPRLEVAVTGLRRSGKTAFITSTIRNLCAFGYNKQALNRLVPPHVGEITSATWFNENDGKRVKSFPYSLNVDSLVNGSWPLPTAGVSKAEVSLRYKTKSFLGKEQEAGLLVSFIDYPGEWLVDVSMEATYDAWAERTLADMRKPSRVQHAADYLGIQGGTDPLSDGSPEVLDRLHQAYVDYLTRCRDAGLVYLQPGRYLMPPEDAKLGLIPAFAPVAVPHGVTFGSKSLVAEMRRRYDAYLNTVNRFYETTFSSSGSQVILVDLIGALNAGQHSFDDTANALKAVHAAILRKRKEGWFNWLWTPKCASACNTGPVSGVIGVQ